VSHRKESFREYCGDWAKKPRERGSPSSVPEQLEKMRGATFGRIDELSAGRQVDPMVDACESLVGPGIYIDMCCYAKSV
jgi:hypothetical protein